MAKTNNTPVRRSKKILSQEEAEQGLGLVPIPVEWEPPTTHKENSEIPTRDEWGKAHLRYNNPLSGIEIKVEAAKILKKVSSIPYFQIPWIMDIEFAPARNQVISDINKYQEDLFIQNVTTVHNKGGALDEYFAAKQEKYKSMYKGASIGITGTMSEHKNSAEDPDENEDLDWDNPKFDNDEDLPLSKEEEEALIKSAKMYSKPYTFSKPSSMHDFFGEESVITRPAPVVIKREIIENVTIGSDFELFLLNTETKDVINAKPFIKGSKENPFNFDTSNPFWCTSLDNVLAEMNIPPAVTEDEFDGFVEKAISYLHSILPPNITTLAEPAMYIKPEFLNTRESQEFGCTPSLNAYTMEENPQPKGSETTLRTGAFHIHIKYNNMSFVKSADLIKIMDLYLGIPALLIEPVNERRKLYGTPGEFRYHPDKTTEYRVLSNYFSKNSMLRKWAFSNTMASIESYNKRGPLRAGDAQQIRDVINRADLSRAEQIIEKFNVPMPSKVPVKKQPVKELF